MSARLLKDPATANCRIFVGHLQTDDTNKVELEQHFSKYGPVIGSLINRGFGFVQFENENAAQAAIQNENGQIFKGRRIDVKPAKKDSHSGNISLGNQSTEDKLKTKGGNQFSTKTNLYSSKNNSFVNISDNQNFNKKHFSGGNHKLNSEESYEEHSKSENDPYETLNSNNDPTKSQHENHFQSFSTSDNSFNNRNLNKDSDKQQLNSGHSNESNNDKLDININRENNSNIDPNININNHCNDDEDASNNNTDNYNVNNDNSICNSTNQNRQNNQNRNHSGLGNQSFNQTSGNNSAHRQRGNRGGKNRNKNRVDSSLSGINYRDRSPLDRAIRGNEEKNRDWDHNVITRNSNFTRDSFNDNRFDDRFKDLMSGVNYNYNRGSFNSNRFDERFKDSMNTGNYSRVLSDYASLPVTDKNDCEIIVVNKSLTEYAEAIEARLKKMYLTVDLLFPNEEVPLSRVLGNIANRGCLYALVITPVNMEHYSITLNILHGLPQEHRNMPVEDALNLIKRDFSNYKSGSRSVPLNTPFASDRHPDAIQVLLNMLADNHQLTVLQYDRLIKYLKMKRDEQVQTELGDAKDLSPINTLAAVNDPKQAELQSRILNILNSNKTSSTNAQEPSSVPVPVPAPSSKWDTGSSSTTTPSITSKNATGVSPSPLLNDPTVQKALDSLLQGNLLKNIGESQPTSVSQPLFAAFPNIDHF